MAVAPDPQRRRLRGLELLQAPQPTAAAPLQDCLEELKRDWHHEGNLAALWQDWPRIAGAQLSPHCQPLSLQRGILTIGASHPQWRQALQYSRSQLLASLRAAGHTLQDLRIQQHHPATTRPLDSEASIWARHPSRADVHGMGSCPRCGRPAPQGEISLWKCCGFCHRERLSL